MLINYDSYDAVRQALAHAEKFITQATGGFFIGTPVAAGISVPVPGVDGVSYTLGLNPHRSEEHTSELQSLMRISYAVFCLQQKKRKQNSPKSQQITKEIKYPRNKIYTI